MCNTYKFIHIHVFSCTCSLTGHGGHCLDSKIYCGLMYTTLFYTLLHMLFVRLGFDFFFLAVL